MARRRRPAATIEDEGIVSERAFTQEKGVALWKEASLRVEAGRDRMREAEAITLGKLKLVPPKHLSRTTRNIDYLIPALPQRKTLVLNMTNSTLEDRPTIHRQRPPKGGTTSDMRAEETETSLNALLLKLFPWPEAVGRAVQQANYLVVTMLAQDLWDAAPPYNDEISEADYAALSAKDKKTYRKRDAKEDRAEGDEGGAVYVRPKQQYWRDAKDNGVESRDYTKRDPKRTRQAHLDDVEEHLANNPPFSIRCYSAYDFAPIRDAEGLKGAVVRQLMEPSELLRKGYRAKGLEDAAEGKVLIPQGQDASLWGRDGKVYLYHFYVWIDGDPCVAYMVGGCDTEYRTGEDADGNETRMDAFHNLREEWGFTRLPIGDYYGLYLEVDDLAARPVPFMDPIGPALIAAEGALGAANITGWRRGTSKYTVQPSPDVPKEAYIEPGTGKLKQIDLDQPGDLVTVYGPVGTLGPLEQSPQSLQVAERYLQSVAEASPAPAAFGGGGSDSGREAALLHTYMQSANKMIPEGLRQAYEDAASYLLEWACCFMRTNEITEIPYYTSEEADPQDGNDDQGERTVLVRLVEAWIGKNYRVKAEVPAKPNPVLIEQEVSLAEKGFGSFEDVQKARGKSNTLKARVDAINDAYWKSERGQAELSSIDARARGDMEKARSYEAFLRQSAAALEVGPDGQVVNYGPSAAMDPMFANNGGAGGPTSAQASLAGTIGAGRSAELQDAAMMPGAAGAPGMAMS